MKATIRIPTQMYGFVEIEVDEDPEKILEIHNAFIRSVAPQTGLPEKEWRQILDKYLTDGEMEADTHAQMNENQKYVINEIKKYYKRFSYKNKT